MATHVIRSPPSGSGSGSGTGGRDQVYQSTNPCLSISSETVLGIARLERYVPFSLVTFHTIPFPLFSLSTYTSFASRFMATHEGDKVLRDRHEK